MAHNCGLGVWWPAVLGYFGYLAFQLLRSCIPDMATVSATPSIPQRDVDDDNYTRISIALPQINMEAHRGLSTEDSSLVNATLPSGPGHLDVQGTYKWITTLLVSHLQPDEVSRGLRSGL